MSFRQKLQNKNSRDTFTKIKEFHHKPLLDLKEVETKDQTYGRGYVLEDEIYPSITTILSLLSKDAIEQWKERIGEEEAQKISKKATDKGTSVHQMCEDYLNNNLTDISKYSTLEKDSFLRLKPILDENVDNILLQEKALFSRKHKTAGRCDLIAEYKGKLSIIDFKTASKEKFKGWIIGYFIQATFYALALYEMTGILIDQIVILITVEHDQPQIFIENPKKYFNEFLKIRKEFSEVNGV